MQEISIKDQLWIKQIKFNDFQKMYWPLHKFFLNFLQDANCYSLENQHKNIDIQHHTTLRKRTQWTYFNWERSLFGCQNLNFCFLWLYLLNVLFTKKSHNHIINIIFTHFLIFITLKKKRNDTWVAPSKYWHYS